MERESGSEDRMERDLFKSAIVDDMEWAGVTAEDMDEGCVDRKKLETRESPVRGFGMVIW